MITWKRVMQGRPSSSCLLQKDQKFKDYGLDPSLVVGHFCVRARGPRTPACGRGGRSSRNCVALFPFFFPVFINKSAEKKDAVVDQTFPQYFPPLPRPNARSRFRFPQAVASNPRFDPGSARSSPRPLDRYQLCPVSLIL